MTDYSDIQHLYRIITPEEWKIFQTSIHYPGSTIDRRSGFLHLSFKEQVERNAKKFYGQCASIILLKLKHSALKDHLYFEKNTPYGDIYPHYYQDALALDAVIEAISVPIITQFDFDNLD